MKAVKFLSVGVFGLLVDSAVFILLQWLGFSLVSSRLIAFWVAIGATYVGNKNFTFESQANERTFFKYFIAMHATGAVNLITFALLTLYLQLSVSLAFYAGIFAGVFLNYYFSSLVLGRKSNNIQEVI